MRYELALLSSQAIKAAFEEYTDNKSDKHPEYGEVFFPAQLQSRTIGEPTKISLDDYMSECVWALSARQNLKLLNSIITTFNDLAPAARTGFSVSNIKRVFFDITDFTVTTYYTPCEEMKFSDTPHPTLELLNLCHFILTKQIPVCYAVFSSSSNLRFGRGNGCL